MGLNGSEPQARPGCTDDASYILHHRAGRRRGAAHHHGLEREGAFACRSRPAARKALALKSRNQADLVLLGLDAAQHVSSGLGVCARSAASSRPLKLPVIMLTARGEEADRVRGLDVGADDYVTKPFSITELMARIKALLRRSRPTRDAEVLRYADLELDTVRHRVIRNGRSVHLGPTEFRLLRFLMERPGRVYSREQLLDSVWGHDIHVELRTVDVHIRRLRRALNAEREADLIRTVRAAGYSLDTASA